MRLVPFVRTAREFTQLCGPYFPSRSPLRDCGHRGPFRTLLGAFKICDELLLNGPDSFAVPTRIEAPLSRPVRDRPEDDPFHVQIGKLPNRPNPRLNKLTVILRHHSHLVSCGVGIIWPAGFRWAVHSLSTTRGFSCTVFAYLLSTSP